VILSFCPSIFIPFSILHGGEFISLMLSCLIRGCSYIEI
jgi:hypothetical protein